MVSGKLGGKRSDVQISVTFQTDPSLILRSYRACHPTAIPTRWAIGMVGLSAGVLARSLLPIVTALVVIILLVSSVRLQLRRYLRGPRQVDVSIDEDGYRTTGREGITRRFPWSIMKSVRRRSGFWVLRATAARAIGLPVDALDAQQTAAFVALVRSKGLLRE